MDRAELTGGTPRRPMPPEVEALFLQDEILQALYWLEGEGLYEAVRPSDLSVLLDSGAERLAPQMSRLQEEGLLEQEEDRFKLTRAGREEGGRRFLDEFRELLRQGHGECGPDCWCHQAESLAESCWGEERAGA